MKSFSYKGRSIFATSKKQALDYIKEGKQEECNLKKLFDYLYPTDVVFDYYSTSKEGKYIKVILYNDLWIEIHPWSFCQYRIIKHDNNSEQKEKELYWSYKELIEYLNVNYEG